MTVRIAAPPRGRSWRLGSRASLVAHGIARTLPISTLLSPDREAP